MNRKLPSIAATLVVALTLTMAGSPAADAGVFAPVGVQYGEAEVRCDAQYKGLEVHANVYGQTMLTSQWLGVRISIWSVTQRRWVRQPSSYTTVNAVVPLDQRFGLSGTPSYLPTAQFTALHRTSLPREDVIVYVEYAWHLNGRWWTRQERITTYTQAAGYYGGVTSSTCRI